MGGHINTIMQTTILSTLVLATFSSLQHVTAAPVSSTSICGWKFDGNYTWNEGITVKGLSATMDGYFEQHNPPIQWDRYSTFNPPNSRAAVVMGRFDDNYNGGGIIVPPHPPSHRTTTRNTWESGWYFPATEIYLLGRANTARCLLCAALGAQTCLVKSMAPSTGALPTQLCSQMMARTSLHGTSSRRIRMSK